MPEIVFQYLEKTVPEINEPEIRWLTAEDYSVYSHHLKLCDQKPKGKIKWRKIYKEGIVYCGLFFNGEMVARACVEPYSTDKWEVSDVRVVRDCRNQGYAYRVCRFILAYIISEGKTPTIRTKENNYPMLSVIKKLGFVPIS